MNTKLILIEGIPGSGKTSTAKAINEQLIQKRISSQLFLEGNVNHPADYEWTACLDEPQYERLLEKYLHLEKQIRDYTIQENLLYLIPYGKMEIEQKDDSIPKSFFEDIGKHDVYNLPLTTYCELLLNRWKSFARQAVKEDPVYIFECAFFQNPINVFLARDDRPFSELRSFLEKLTNIISPLDPVLIYLNQENIEETINRVRKERSPEWFDFVSRYFTQQEFGKNRGLSGFDGVISYLTSRKEAEKMLLDLLPMETRIIDNSTYDWKKVNQEISRF
ncbi:hypothetical protein ACLM5H_18770 [Fredinandcohnia humi]